MEVKINREIRNYTESMFFGLSLRQFVFSLLAVGVAVVLYFVLKPYVGTETVSWMCILGAAPFAAMGFITYNGMTAEQFVWAWLRSEMIEPKQIKFEPINIYYEALKDTCARSILFLKFRTFIFQRSRTTIFQKIRTFKFHTFG